MSTSNSSRVQEAPHRFWHNFWQVLKTIQARLRFIAILAVVGAAIVYWDALTAHYEKWTRPFVGEETAASDSSHRETHRLSK